MTYVQPGGLGQAEDSRSLEDRVRASAEAAQDYLRARWAEFLNMGPRIIDLQHEAALVAQRARARGDEAGVAAAKLEIAQLGELNLAHGWAVDTYQLERVGQAIGLGALPALVPAAIFSSLALVVIWAFRAFQASERKLELIEAGVMTPAQAAALDPGPSPRMLFTGATGLAQMALWGAGLFVLYQLVTRYAPRRNAVSMRNPPLEVWSNPPDFGEEVHDVTYRHAEDGEDYIHSFGPDVEMAALDDGTVLISRADGKPVWGEFEVEEDEE